MSRKIILYIAASVDGYIAKPNDNLDFLSIVQQEGEDYGYGDFIRSVDTVILGRKTYDWVMKQVPVFPHADKTTFVITRTEKPSIGRTNFFTGHLHELITRLKNEEGKNIFIDGGAEVVNALLKENLIDELIISVIPVLLGEGVRLFSDGRPEEKLELVSAKPFRKGLVQLHYRRIDG
ncbi:MAG TPA: dihydrofolate reductase family protein [Bacteroidia bacterium]|nr:dihydrofolate reductase family protein [Bacteroidia bacterium]